MNTLQRLAIALLFALTLTEVGSAPRDWLAPRDDEVVESLPPRVRAAQLTPQGAAQAARAWISLSRQSADPRYLGRAQASLGPWWDRADAPSELAVLQATIEQSRHAFDAARITLQRTLAREPAQAQGWLTLATLERVAAHYAAAEAACMQVARQGAMLYATACQLETRSMQGQHDAAREGLRQLQRQSTEPATQAWLLSLLAESEERAGRDEAAAAAFQASLILAGDGYTALAYADLLLRVKQPAPALKVLAEQAASDAVLLRRAYAHKQLGDTTWRGLATELRERFAALDARGDAPSLHARDRALAALWLDDNPAKAWPAAQANLILQKEPLDWWLALHTAQASGHSHELAQVVNAFQRSGLRDARLARWQRGQSEQTIPNGRPS